MPRARFLFAWLFPAALLLGTAGTGTNAQEPSPRARIKNLEAGLQSSDNPDSLRYLMAIAYREAGTIEDRYRALELLEKIRRSYEKDPEYHRELARTYEASARYMDARSSLKKVIELRPEEVEARVDIVRLLMRELLYTYDLSLTDEMIEVLDGALDLDPDNRDALFYLSLTLHLACERSSADRPPLIYRGKEAAERILARNPADLDARFMLAIHLLNLNQVNQADLQFEQCVVDAPPEIQEALISSDGISGRSLTRYAHDLDPETRQNFYLAYWRSQDPTPLTLANENQLEYWKRMALAHFFFGDPQGKKPGWDTDPGRALVRYGLPNSRTFDPGAVVAADKPGDPYARFKPNLHFAPPSWSWNYSFRDISFTLKFEDRTLQGKFQADDNSMAAMTALESAAPVVFQEASPGRIRDLYLTGVGIAGKGAKNQESIYVGVPPWRDNSSTEWLKDSRIEVLVRDSTYTQVSRSVQRVSSENIYRPFRGTEILLFSRQYDLNPGKYTFTVYLEDKEANIHGAFSRPVTVRSYHTGSLEVSDLELALGLVPEIEGPKVQRMGRTYLPNPMGLVGDQRNLDVLYEIYNLAVEGGYASYLLQYTILPLSYVVAFDYHVAKGNASREDLAAFAAAGLALGNVRPTATNYSDVKFPKETVPLQPGQRVVKGAQVDVRGLDPGKYVLLVTVTDSINQEAATSQTVFQILTDGDLKSLLAHREDD